MQNHSGDDSVTSRCYIQEFPTPNFPVLNKHGSAPGIDLPSSVRVGHCDISFSSAARNLGVIFDSELALKEQVNKLCQLAYVEIRRIGSIRQYLSVEATKTLVSSLVLSRLDYCNALLAGCPQVLLVKIQRVINCSARLIYKA